MITKHAGVLPLFFAATLLIGVAACREKGPAEKAGEKIDHGLSKAGDKVEHAGDKIKDAVDGKH